MSTYWNLKISVFGKIDNRNKRVDGRCCGIVVVERVAFSHSPLPLRQNHLSSASSRASDAVTPVSWQIW